MEYCELRPLGRVVFNALIQCISQDRSLLGGGALLQREDPRISIKVVTCRKKVAVDWPCSLLLRCCSVVAETVADGFRCLAYLHFGTFRTDDDIDKVYTGTCNHLVSAKTLGKLPPPTTDIPLQISSEC